MFANTSVREGLANSAAMEQLRGDDASPDGARRAPDEPDAAPAAASGDADDDPPRKEGHPGHAPLPLATRHVWRQLAREARLVL